MKCNETKRNAYALFCSVMGEKRKKNDVMPSIFHAWILSRSAEFSLSVDRGFDFVVSF